MISIKPPTHASQSPRPASPVLAACAASAPPPDTVAQFWVCSAPFASPCRRSLRRLVRPPARRRSRKSRRNGVCRRNGAPTALLRMLAGSPLGRSKRSAPPRGGARSRPAGRGAGTGLAPERAGGGGERLLGLWWPEAPGPRGRRLWLRRPRPKDPPRLGLRRVRAPLPPPPGRCPVSTGPSGPGRVPGPTAWPRPRPGLPGGPEGC